MKPLLSVCIPTYNRSVYLKECLESVLFSANGLEDRIEIIISDNNSLDDTASVVEEFQIRYPWIRYEKNLDNIGCERNIYKLVTKASAEYIWVMGDDDKAAKGVIPAILHEIESGYDLIISNYSIHTRDFSRVKVPINFPLTDAAVFDDPDDVMKHFGAHLGYISNQVMKKSVFFAAPREEYESFIEYGFSIMYTVYYGLMPKSRILYLPEPLVCNRSDNSGGYDWYKCVVVGTSLVLTALQDRGYSPGAMLAAKRRVLKDWVIRDILVRKRDGQSTKGLFRIMYPHYKKNWLFWLGCVPALLTPGFVVQIIDAIVLKPRRLRRYIKFNSCHKE